MPDAGAAWSQRRDTVPLPLQVDGLCYRVDEETLIDNISVSIDSPGISVILGPNGAGKSLFLRLIHGLIDPSAGDIRWRGRPPDLAQRRRQALVFQKPVLLRRSVAANIDFVLKPLGAGYRERRDQILQAAGLFRLRDHPARLLSGGEQQKLALARALATDPAVLLLDEPCASIDAGSTLQIETLLEQTSARGVKILLVTHNIGQARRLADDVLFLHHGRLLEYSPAEAFMKCPKSPPAQAFIDGNIVL
ncbi:MAG: Tungstate ABC transporter, ATP-binding protein [Olavius algarvensis Gamma 3 endosymbiont]|nr:MAG: Tungstate ABC transporter, ATP-binding protein [Olavius algarvensis Gamma 3 endosymbiont]